MGVSNFPANESRAFPCFPVSSQTTPAPSPAPPLTGGKLLRRLLVGTLLGVLVYAGFALYRGIADIGERLSLFSWEAFAFACALALGNYLLRYWKWEYYLARLGIRGIPKLDSLLVYLSGFVLTVTPGKVGEVFKSFLLNERYRIPVAATAPILVAERLTDVIGIVLLIFLGSTGFEGGLAWAIAGTVLVLFSLAAISSSKVVSWTTIVVGKLPGRVGAMAPKLRDAWQSLRSMTSPRALVLPTLLSVIAWWLEGLALWVILSGFDESVPMPLACFFYSTATLAGALIPVPGGLGITEGALEEQLATLGGVSPATSTSAMILVRIATLWFAVLVGFVALAWFRARQKREARPTLA